MKLKHPLSRCAASPSLATREGDDAFAARRLLLGVPGLERAGFQISNIFVAASAYEIRAGGQFGAKP
ncbi:MAG: hypothetical protein E2585_21895 [Comamonas sp.]|nr:hypothetical protein [Comamonas sp.]